MNMDSGGIKEGLKFGSGTTGQIGIGLKGLLRSSGWQHIGQEVMDQRFMTGKHSLQYWTFAGASGRVQRGLRYGRLNTGGAAWAAGGGLAKV